MIWRYANLGPPSSFDMFDESFADLGRLPIVMDRAVVWDARKKSAVRPSIILCLFPSIISCLFPTFDASISFMIVSIQCPECSDTADVRGSF